MMQTTLVSQGPKAVGSMDRMRIEELIAKYRRCPFPVTYEALSVNAEPISRFEGLGDDPEGVRIVVLGDLERALELVSTVPYRFIVTDYIPGNVPEPAGRIINRLITDIDEQRSPYTIKSPGVVYGPTIFLNGPINQSSLNLERCFGEAYGLNFDRAYKRGDVLYLGEVA